MKKLSLLFVILPFFVQTQEIVVEEVNLKNGEVSLPGTLSYPDLGKKTPLLIFVHGSGNVDRNGNQGALAKANYIKQLADSLNKNDIAFYRFDKRTSNPSNFKFLKDISFQDFVSDISLVINHFKNDARFKSIHLIGHSQGSLVSMLAIDENIKSYISLAGPSSSIDKVITKQIKSQNEELGKITRKHFDELAATDTILSVNPLLTSIFLPQNQKFFKSWMGFSPTDEIKKVKKPILIIQGEEDTQVDVTDANSLMRACTEANSGFGAPAQLVLIKNMNHVLKTIESKEQNIQSYTSPDFPLSEKLVESIVTFILKNE
jgi:fermentation-respiration switch protein FrsA (DUF1100 family)